MSMFDNYNNIHDEYISSNKDKHRQQYIPADRKPYEEYNEEGELIGYSWRYGDRVNLQFELSGEITIPDNSIVYSVSGYTPTSATKGEINQKAYNVMDLISWTCVMASTDEYMWLQDDEFTYPEQGKNVFFTLADYIKGKTIRLNIFNFRHEEIYTENFEGNTTIELQINNKLSAKLIKGIYYLDMVVCDQENDNYINAIDNLQLIIK